MSRIKQLVRPESQALNWKAALPVIGFALAGLVGCAQQPPAGARQDAAMSMGPMKIHAKVIETDAVADFNSCPRPVYPAVALQNKVEGTVSLGFLIGANGRVLDTTLRESSGDASLDQAARIALAKCSFKPATVNGTPIDRWTDVKYVWAAH